MATVSRELRPPIAQSRAMLAVLGSLVAVTLALIGVTLNRGFDWNDEGFIVALTSSARSAPGDVWGFHFLLHPLFELVGESIVVMRIIRLLGYAALGLLLTVIAARALHGLGVQLRRPSWMIVALVGQSGTFFAFAYPARHLGYNELSGWLTQLGVALLVLLLVSPAASARDSGTRRLWLLWGAVGAAFLLLFVSKVTAAAMLGVALIVVVVVLWMRAPHMRLPMLGLPAGAGAAALVLLLTGVPLLKYTGNLLALVLDPSGRTNGYTVTSLLNSYLLSAWHTASTVAVPIMLAAAAVFVASAGARRVGTAPTVDDSPLRRIAPIAALLAAALLSLPVIVFPGGGPTWTQLGVTLAFLMGLAAIGLAALAPVRGDVVAGPGRLRIGVAISLLAIAPLLSSAGTNNAIFGHGVFAATLWCVCSGVALAVLWERVAASSLSARLAVAAMLTTSVAVPALFVATDVLLHPYGTAPYLSQRSTITEGPLRGISLTYEEAQTVQWLMERSSALDAAGVPTISMSPGHLVLFNSSPWTNLWPSQDWPTSIAASCATDPPGDLMVIQAANYQRGDDRYEWMVAGLEACGIVFPDDFEVVDHHESSDRTQDLTLWQLR